MLRRLLRRDQRPHVAPVRSGAPAGTLPCASPGCEAHTGIACAYVDRRGQQCATAWCGDHAVVLGSEVLCRRHASVRVVLSAADGPHIPDVDSRAASLLQWVTTEVGDGIIRLLGALDQSMSVQVDPPRLVFIGRDRVRAWERGWKLGDHTGVHFWVALAVEEVHDDEVVIRVNGAEVDRMVPPWIEARRRHEHVEDTADAVRRRAFNDMVLAVIADEVSMEPAHQGRWS